MEIKLRFLGAALTYSFYAVKEKRVFFLSLHDCKINLLTLMLIRTPIADINTTSDEPP